MVTGDRITAVGSATEEDFDEIVDITGLIIGPGFIDLRSHAQSIAGHRLQAFDGVTTTFESESGLDPVDRACAIAAGEGRPLQAGSTAIGAAQLA